MDSLLSSTSDDLAGDWSAVLNKLWDLMKIYKIKVGKLKSLEQIYVRSFFFAR